MPIEEFLTAYGLAAIFAVMLVKGIGIPIPIPSDLIMIITAAQVALGRFGLWQAFLVILAAMVAGGSVQFLLARALGRKFLYRLGRYIGLTQERLDRVSATIRKSGPFALGVSLVTPGIRSAAVPAAGLAGLPYLTFFTGAMIGSVLFLALHFAIGLIGGPLIAFVMSAINLPMVVFFAAFFCDWLDRLDADATSHAPRDTRTARRFRGCGVPGLSRDWRDGTFPTRAGSGRCAMMRPFQSR